MSSAIIRVFRVDVDVEESIDDRSERRVARCDVEICGIYVQIGGAPDDLGRRLTAFCESRRVVDGIRSDPSDADYDLLVNGAECLAAQIVATLKRGPGEVYLYPAQPNGLRLYTHYEYRVRCENRDGAKIEVRLMPEPHRSQYGNQGNQVSS